MFSITDVNFRSPSYDDAKSIFEIAKRQCGLSANSEEFYHLAASHFFGTCVLGELKNDLYGFLLGYERPNRPGSIFVWQMLVVEGQPSREVFFKLLEQLILRHSNTYPLLEVSVLVKHSDKSLKKSIEDFISEYQLNLLKVPFIKKNSFRDGDPDARALFVISSKSLIKDLSTVIKTKSLKNPDD